MCRFESCQAHKEGLKLPYIDEAVHDDVDDDVGKGTGLELLHNVFAVGDDGAGADVELVGHFFVDIAFGEEDGDFELTG